MLRSARSKAHIRAIEKADEKILGVEEMAQRNYKN
jgi:hypothetical protein